jgi:hypothetical protein
MSLQTSIENFLAVKSGRVVQDEEDVPIAPSKRKGVAPKDMDGVPGPPDDIPGPPSDDALLSLGDIPGPPDDILPPPSGGEGEAEDADGEKRTQADEALARGEALTQDAAPAADETPAQDTAPAETAAEAPASGTQDLQTPMDEDDELLERAKRLLADADDLTWTPDISWQADDPLQEDTDWL